MGESGVGHLGADLSQFPFTSRSLSTHVSCLLATGFLGQKHSLCYYNVCVYPTNPPLLVASGCVGVFLA